ncbi:unnamed protein product [Alopecurus aequalis]
MAALVTPAASLVSKLMVQGRQSAAVLEALLQDASPHESAGVRELAAEILRCCDRALAALHGGNGDGDSDGAMVAGAGGRKRKSGPGDSAAETRPKRRTRPSGAQTTAKRVEKKWTSEDGFIWRKYGQKEILNCKNPRLYFRCTYSDDSGCPATRQVQQSEEDPSLYVITYFGDHTCCADVAAAAASEVADLGETHPFVINFGSAAASSGSPPWLSSSSDDGDGQSETTRSSSPNGCLTEGGDGEEAHGAMVTKIEPTSTSELQPAAELSSPGDASCSSPAWDPLAACSDWDCFDVTSLDCFSEFFNFDDIPLYQ